MLATRVSYQCFKGNYSIVCKTQMKQHQQNGQKHFGNNQKTYKICNEASSEN